MSPSPNPSEITRRQIVSTIRSGAYVHVAAMAWGVSPDQLAEWVRRGRKKRAREPLRSFARDVASAQAQARAKAEMALYEKNPRLWLEHGPGRDKPHSPGWSSSFRGSEVAAGLVDSTLLQPQITDLLSWLHNELGAFPDARIHLSTKASDKNWKIAPVGIGDLFVL